MQWTQIDELVAYAKEQCDIGANAIVVMGGEDNGIPRQDFEELIIKLSQVAPIGLYTARKTIDFLLPLKWVKVGEYKEQLGGLSSSATNQRFYRLYPDFEDITYLFQKE